MTGFEKAKYDGILKELRGGEYESLAKYWPKLDEEQIAFKIWLRWKVLTDLYFLGVEIFKYPLVEGKRSKKGVIDPKYHKWMCGILQREQDTILLSPRYTLKSSWIKTRVVQLVLQQPNTAIGLFSSTGFLVEKELGAIARMFAHPLLMSVFPDRIPAPGKDFKNWQKKTANELTIWRDESGYVPQESQITAFGCGANIVGQHFKWAFLDDVVTPDNVTTLDQMQKVVDWWEYLQPILGPDSIKIITGTHYHYNDLYAQIVSEGQIPKENVYRRAAIEGGKAIYSLLDLRALEKLKKSMSNYKFSCQFMNNPIPQEDKLFPPPQPTFTQLAPNREYKYYIAVDPAATTNKWSDETGIAVGAFDGKTLWIVEAIGVKLPPNELADLIIRKQIQYEAKRVGIELGLQEALRYVIEMKRSQREASMGKRLSLSIMPIPVKSNKSKVQRIASSLGAFCREKKCIIGESCKQLLAEMDMYTGKDNEKDNVIDAASMLFQTVDAFSQFFQVPEQFRNPVMTLRDLFKVKPKFEWAKGMVS